MVENHEVLNNKDKDFKEALLAEEKFRKQNDERQEYMIKLKKWLDDARLWHLSVCTRFPYSTINNENLPQHFVQYSSLTQMNNDWNQHLRNGFQMFTDNINRNGAAPIFHTSPRLSHQPPNTYEFVIPPLWKRAVAELMDFLLLFLLKMALTFLLLESFDIIDMELYGFESFQKNLENTEVAMPMAIELLTLEVIHRAIVCIYETYFLRGKFCATPGKRYMGLMVVTAESIAPGRLADTITATRATPLNWQKSLIRAALKNILVGLFVPLCIAFYILPYNRTSYDMMANSVVVEYHQEFMLYHSAM